MNAHKAIVTGALAVFMLGNAAVAEEPVAVGNPIALTDEQMDVVTAGYAGADVWAGSDCNGCDASFSGDFYIHTSDGYYGRSASASVYTQTTTYHGTARSSSGASAYVGD